MTALASNAENVTTFKLQTSERAKVSRERPVHCSADGGLQISHPAWMESIGTDKVEAAEYIAVQLATFAGNSGNIVSEKELDFLTQTVMAVAPRDHIEMLLATQMAAVHQLTMTVAMRAKRSENIPKSEVYHRQTNQLMRTFAAQTEALKRYRTGGKQTVKVKHVHVHEGGQAIVGNVQGRGKGGE